MTKKPLTLPCEGRHHFPCENTGTPALGFLNFVCESCLDRMEKLLTEKLGTPEKWQDFERLVTEAENKQTVN